MVFGITSVKVSIEIDLDLLSVLYWTPILVLGPAIAISPGCQFEPCCILHYDADEFAVTRDLPVLDIWADLSPVR